MKIHILVISSTKNGQTATEEPVPFFFLGKARKELKKAVSEAYQEKWIGKEWTTSKTTDSFFACAEPDNPEVDYYSAEIITKKIVI